MSVYTLIRGRVLGLMFLGLLAGGVNAQNPDSSSPQQDIKKDKQDIREDKRDLSKDVPTATRIRRTSTATSVTFIRTIRT
jgi:hypothetical protein